MSEINSIIEIRNLRDQIREKIQTRDKNLHLDSKFGSENEYTFNGLIGGISAILTDISTLTKAPTRFIKLSTYNERQSIIQSLNYINQHFNSPSNYISYFESIKSLIRSFNLRFSNERHLEFEKEMDSVMRLKLEFEDTLIEIKQISEELNNEKDSIRKLQESSNESLEILNSKIEEIENKSIQFNNQFESFQNITSEIDNIKSKSNDLLDEIIASHNESVSNEKLINSFASKIDSSENKLTSLNNNIDKNEEKLTEYQSERVAILAEAKELIESAKEALNYKTAEGISASFQTHYDESVKFKNKEIWLLLSGICLLITISLGIWILLDHNKQVDVSLIITRISLLPFPIFGAIFCANQYNKQKNISEDYAYKMVIAKSIVGFSEQLKKHSSNDQSEYLHYIKTALEEIHKDPLRNRKIKNSKDDNIGNQKLNEIIEIAEKIKNIAN